MFRHEIDHYFCWVWLSFFLEFVFTRDAKLNRLHGGTPRPHTTPMHIRMCSACVERACAIDSFAALKPHACLAFTGVVLQPCSWPTRLARKCVTHSSLNALHICRSQFIQQQVRLDRHNVDKLVALPEGQDAGVWQYEHMRQMCLELNGLVLALEPGCKSWLPQLHGALPHTLS